MFMLEMVSALVEFWKLGGRPLEVFQTFKLEPHSLEKGHCVSSRNNSVYVCGKVEQSTYRNSFQTTKPVPLYHLIDAANTQTT